MAWQDDPVTTGTINTYVRRLIEPELLDFYTQTNPLLAIMAGGAIERKATRNPRTAVTFGGADLGTAKRQTLNGSVDHTFRYKTGELDDGTGVEPGGDTASATQFAGDKRGTTRFYWAKKFWPVKVRNTDIDNARNAGNKSQVALAIASILDEAMEDVKQISIKNQQTDMWSGTLTAAQQNVGDKGLWANKIGVTHQVSDGTSSGQTSYTHVGRVDRTVETELKANVNLAADLISSSESTMSSTTPKLELLWELKIVDTFGGIMNKQGNAGDLCVTTPAVWMKFREEADDAHIFQDGKIPGTRIVGFNRPVIQYGTTSIIFDNECPSGELYLFTTPAWVYEVQAGNNYAMRRWVDKSQTEEGGGDYSWSNLVVQDRFTCRKPWLQTKVTGLLA